MASEEPVASPATEPRAEPSVFLRLVNRYISVWIWSILFGLAVSLSFSLTNVRSIGRFGEASLAIGALYLLAALCVFRTWLGLLRYLRDFIIPMIFAASDMASDAHPSFKELHSSFGWLVFAFMLLMLASFGLAALELFFFRAS